MSLRPSLVHRRLARTCTALLFAPLAAASFLSAETVEIVGSDGSRWTVRSARAEGGSVSLASPPRRLAAGERRDLEANLPNYVLSPAEWLENLSARPAKNLFGSAESIIGADQRTRVTPTTKYPNGAVVAILFRPKGGGSQGLCSGNLIGPDTVATAGHCIYDVFDDKDFYDPNSYEIFAGRNGTARPFGTCKAKTIYTNNNWIAKGHTNTGDVHDYGAIKLNCTVGNSTGWFGFFSKGGSLKNLNAIIQGYPGDKPLTQWKSTGKVTVSQTQRTFYQNDTVGGMSGSGVFCNGKKDPGCPTVDTFPYIHSIHAYGTYGNAPFKNNNHATRITTGIFNFLKGIRDL